MQKRTLILICFIIFYVVNSNAQSVLKGRIQDDLYDRVVMGATIHNISAAKTAQSDMGGNYSISVNIGDVIRFTSTGYIADSLTVTQNMLTGTYDVFLTRNVMELEEVEVGGKLNRYQMDSLARIEEFGEVLNKNHSKFVGGKGNAPTDGVGIAISPVSHFSKEEKELRRFKRFFAQQEREYYIDYKFPHGYVAKITRLTGDSLRSFMLTYRPSYEFVRKSSREEMLLYINDSYKKFMEPKPKRSGKKKSST